MGNTHDGENTMSGDNNSVKTKLRLLNPKLWDIHGLPHYNLAKMAYDVA